MDGIAPTGHKHRDERDRIGLFVLLMGHDTKVNRSNFHWRCLFCSGADHCQEDLVPGA